MLPGQGKKSFGVLNGCANCRVRRQCLPADLSQTGVEQFEQIISQHPPLHRGDILFSQGSPLDSIYAIRSGSVKSVVLYKSGQSQVNSFNFCGDILGLEGIETRYHPTSAVALETTSVCSVPFDRLNELANKIPSLRHQLFRILSFKLETENLRAQNFANGTAKQRLMVLFINLGEHRGRCNCSTNEFNLSMTRRDIASFLGIAYETLARLLAHLQEVGLIKIKNRSVIQILQRELWFQYMAVLPESAQVILSS